MQLDANTNYVLTHILSPWGEGQMSKQRFSESSHIKLKWKMYRPLGQVEKSNIESVQISLCFMN